MNRAERSHNTFMTVAEVARVTGFSQWFVYSELKGGRLVGYRFGPHQRTIRVRADDLASYLAQSRASDARGSNPSIGEDGHA